MFDATGMLNYVLVKSNGHLRHVMYLSRGVISIPQDKVGLVSVCKRWYCSGLKTRLRSKLFVCAKKIILNKFNSKVVVDTWLNSHHVTDCVLVIYGYFAAMFF